MKKWGIGHQNDVRHVYPINDLEEHLIKTRHTRIGNAYCDCECNPKVERDGDIILIVHNSFDGREVFEQAKEMIKNNLN